MLEKELRKNPKAATAELQEKAAEIKTAVAKMSLPSFHGTHVGTVKRKISGKKGGRKKGATTKKAVTKKGGRPRATSLSAVARASYEEKKAAVIAGMDGAFDKAVAADRLSGLEKLLARMDKAGRMF